MKISHPQTTYGLNLSFGSAGTYSGWDRFGRAVEQKWTLNSGTVLDQETYAYDRNSNMTSRTNVLNSALSETYTFDGLDRLASMTRNGSAYQSWTLEGSGNWKSFTNQGSTQTRTHNAANEVSTISGKTSPTHDANGNVTQAPKPATSGDQVYVYDGWSRLTQVKEIGGTVIAAYEYDPRGNRIQKTISSTVRDFYHNEAAQVVEVRVSGTLNQVFVWDLSFVDSPVMTKRDTGSDGTLDQSYYFTFDALRNVTALINASNGNVIERYHYDAYGSVQMYNGSWTTISSSAYGNFVLFTGRERDTESGLYYFRARYFDPALGRFLARDPIGYVDGMNLYQGYFVHGGVDPEGLRVVAIINGVIYHRNPDGSWPDDMPRDSDLPIVWAPEMADSDDSVVGYTANGRRISEREAKAIERTRYIALGVSAAALAGVGGLLLAGVNPVLWGGAAAAGGATAGAATTATATVELGIGTQAVVAPGLGAGSYPALLINNTVYVARFHQIAWDMACKAEPIAKYGIAIIDKAGKVIGWL